MAATKHDVILSNGQTLSVWQLSNQAVNTNPGCTLDGPAAATTLTTDFTVRSDCCISKIVVPAGLTAGGWEVYNVSKGMRSGKGVSNLEIYLVANALITPPRICFRAGTVYRLIYTVAGNA